MLRFLAIAILVLSCKCGPNRDFDGDWSGTWAASLSDGQQGGSMVVRVASGAVVGNGTNVQNSNAFSVAGTIGGGGYTEMVYTYPGQSTYRASGVLKMLAWHAVGTFDLALGSAKIGTSSVDMTRQ